MPYRPYADSDFYRNEFRGDLIPEALLEKALFEASRHIDALTYNRIVGRGFSRLTPFQQDVIREVVCRQAEFEYENEELLNSVLSGYSINGVSMSMTTGWNVHTDKGVAMTKETYILLQQTGLTCGVIRGY